MTTAKDPLPVSAPGSKSFGPPEFIQLSIPVGLRRYLRLRVVEHQQLLLLLHGHGWKTRTAALVVFAWWWWWWTSTIFNGKAKTGIHVVKTSFVRCSCSEPNMAVNGNDILLTCLSRFSNRQLWNGIFVGPQLELKHPKCLWFVARPRMLIKQTQQSGATQEVPIHWPIGVIESTPLRWIFMDSHRKLVLQSLRKRSPSTGLNQVCLRIPQTQMKIEKSIHVNSNSNHELYCTICFLWRLLPQTK